MPPRRGRPPLPRARGGRIPRPEVRERIPTPEPRIEDTDTETVIPDVDIPEEEVQSESRAAEMPRAERSERVTMRTQGSTQSVQVGENPQLDPQTGLQQAFEQMMRAMLANMMAGVTMPPTAAPVPMPHPEVGNTAQFLGRYVKELRDLGCWTFAGQTDPEVAFQWITKMEATLEETHVPEDIQVRAVAQFLEHAAHSWWRTLKARQPTGYVMRWAEFRTAFDRQYYSKVMRKGKEKEFLHLVQGGMTVLEYEQRFQELSRFAVRIVGDEEDLVERFVDGLNPEIRTAVYSLKASGRSFDEIVETAQVAERGALEARGNTRNPLGSKGNAKGDSVTGRARDAEKRNAGPTTSRFSGSKRSRPETKSDGSRVTKFRGDPPYVKCGICE